MGSPYREETTSHNDQAFLPCNHLSDVGLFHVISAHTNKWLLETATSSSAACAITCVNAVPCTTYSSAMAAISKSATS